MGWYTAAITNTQLHCDHTSACHYWKQSVL